MSAYLYGASSSNAQDSKHVDLKERLEQYAITQSSRKIHANFSNYCYTLEPEYQQLTISKDWTSALVRHGWSEPSYIYSSDTISWLPFIRDDYALFGFRIRGFNDVLPRILDLRHFLIDEESKDNLLDFPPPAGVKVIITTAPIKIDDDEGYSFFSPQQMTPDELMRFNSALAQRYQQPLCARIVSTIYRWRYAPCAIAAVYMAYRFVQRNQPLWQADRAQLCATITEKINQERHAIDTMQAIINHASQRAGKEVAQAFTGIGPAKERLAILIDDLPLPWNITDSLLEVIKRMLWSVPCAKLYAFFVAMFAVDKYVIKNFLGYTPHHLPPTIEACNDKENYYCSPPTLKKKLTNWWYELPSTHYDYWHGGCGNCRSIYRSPFCRSNTLCNNPEQDRIFARNRKIAAGVAVTACGLGSFYAGRMLYRNADKLMALLSK